MSLGKPLETINDALRHLESGNITPAEEIARSILKRNARDLNAQRVLALAQARRHQPDKAIAMLKKCIAKAPEDVFALRDLGKICLEAGKFEEALEAFDRAIRVEPRDHDSIIGKADVLEKAGRFEEARAVLQPYFDRGVATWTMCAVMSRLAQQTGNHEEAVRLALMHVDSSDLLPRHAGLLYQTAGQSYEKLERYDKAFECFARAKAIMRRPFNREMFRERIDALIAIFTKENIARLPKARDRSELPIFIVSMPRSGSTLVEQFIHAHPDAFGAGEIPHMTRLIVGMQEAIGSFQTYPDCIGDLKQQHVDDMAGSYLKDLRQLAPGKKRVVDKLLDSYAHLGMYSVLFPAGRAIYVERDPLDNCFGIFMANLNADSIRYSADLGDIGFVHGQFRRMMRHWQDHLDYNLLHVVYEEIVEDSDAWIRKIIAFTGLPWDDRCLRYYEAKRDVITLSYDQVRKPIFKSAVKRWQKYDAFLGPLRESLKANADV